MNKTIFKRLLAYTIDILIVTLFISVLSFIPIINKSTNTYDNYTNKINNLYEDYINKEITEEEYNNKLIDLTYKNDKETITYTIVNITIITLYFVVFQYFNKGQTIGKKVLNIKVKPQNNSIITYLIRSLIINNLFSIFINLILVLTLNKSLYYTMSTGITNICSILLYASVITAFLRPDNKTLHDLLSKSEVIDLKNDNEVNNEKEEKNNKIIDAVYEEN